MPTLPLLTTCCTPLVDAPLEDDRARALAAVFKALGDPNRLRLVSLIQAHEGGTACVCDLTAPLGLSQPTVSHHLRVLREAGIVDCEKRGVWAYYRLVPEALPALSALLAAPVVGPAPGGRAPGEPADPAAGDPAAADRAVAGAAAG